MDSSGAIDGRAVVSVVAIGCEDDSGMLDVVTASCWGACELGCETSFACGSAAVVVCGCCEAISTALVVSVCMLWLAGSALAIVDETSGFDVAEVVGSLVARDELLVDTSIGAGLIEAAVVGSGDKFSLPVVVVVPAEVEVLAASELVSIFGSPESVVMGAAAVGADDSSVEGLRPDSVECSETGVPLV